MKYVLSIGVAVLCAPALWAESLCGVADEVVLWDQLSGAWSGATAVSVETETLSVTQSDLEGHVSVFKDSRFKDGRFKEGRMSWSLIEGIVGAGETFDLALVDTVYDVDGVDDLLDTTETPEMADILSDTPCGPEALPQWQAVVDYAPDPTGTVTLIGYFEDRVLMLSELEMRGDWGLGATTYAAILTPAE